MSSSQVHGVSPGELQAAQQVDALRREGEGEVEIRRLTSLRSISDFWPVHRAVVDGSSMLSLNDELVGGGLDVRTMSDKRLKALFLAQLEPRSLASRKAFVGAYIKQPRSTTDDTERQDWGGSRIPAGYALFELPPTFSSLADDRDEVEETLLGEFGEEGTAMDVEYVARRARELEAVWESVLEGREHWHLDRLYVDPGVQGRGIGSKLLKWGTDQADERGECITLLTTPEGREIYHHKHFRPVSDTTDDPHLFREPRDGQLSGLIKTLSPPKRKRLRLPSLHSHKHEHAGESSGGRR